MSGGALSADAAGSDRATEATGCATDGAAEIAVGVLDELAELVDAVADRIQDDGWSICPCGEEHDQGMVDIDTLPVMRRHAALAHGLGGQVDG